MQKKQNADLSPSIRLGVEMTEWVVYFIFPNNGPSLHPSVGGSGWGLIDRIS